MFKFKKLTLFRVKGKLTGKIRGYENSNYKYIDVFPMIMQDPPTEHGDLTDKVKANLRGIANMVVSSFTHPFENTLIDRTTGEIVRHYKPEPERQYIPVSDENTTKYGPIHYLKLVYLIGKESMLHPTCTSYINKDTLEVRREKTTKS